MHAPIHLPRRQGAQKLRKQALREHTHLSQRWSKLSAAEHEWYLTHEREVLLGAERERMEALKGRVQVEKQDWVDAMTATVQEQWGERYMHCTARQEAQLGDDMVLRRRQVAALPRLYRLQATCPVPELPDPNLPQPPVAAAQLQHMGQLRAVGDPLRVALPPAGTILAGDKLYLPASLAEGSSQKGASGPSRGGGGGGGVFRKLRPPPLAADPVLLELAGQVEAQQQQQGGQGGGGGGGSNGQPPAPLFSLAASAMAAVACTVGQHYLTSWEIPVRITEQSAPVSGGAPDGAGDSRGTGAAASGGRRRIFLDKPLLPRGSTLRARQHLLQKYAWLSAAVRQAAETAGTGDQPATGGGVPTREASYDEWRLGSHRLLVRSHGRLLAPAQLPSAADDGAGEAECAAGSGGSGDGSPDQQQNQRRVRQRQQAQQQQQQQDQPPASTEPVVLSLKEEYLPDPDREEDTVSELAACALALLLRPAAAVVLQVAVDVPGARVLGYARRGLEQLDQAMRGGEGMVHQVAAQGAQLLQALLEGLEGLPPGDYMASYIARDTEIAVFRALPPDVQLGEVRLMSCPRSAVCASCPCVCPGPGTGLPLPCLAPALPYSFPSLTVPGCLLRHAFWACLRGFVAGAAR